MNICNLTRLTAVLSLVFLSTTGNAAKYEFIATDQSIGSQLCVLAGNNNRGKLVRTMKDGGYNIRQVVNTMTCNDMGMAHFAHKYDAGETFSYLNSLSNSKNRIETPSVTIRDITAAVNHQKSAPRIIYVRSGN